MSWVPANLASLCPFNSTILSCDSSHISSVTLKMILILIMIQVNIDKCNPAVVYTDMEGNNK